MSLVVQNHSVKTPNSILTKPFSFEMTWGDRLIVCGQNGEGKSTFLKELASSLYHKHPSLIWTVDPQKVHFLPQNSYFHGKSADSVLDYLIKSTELYQSSKMKKKDIVLHANEVMKKLNLKDKWISHLSGGEKQKLKIAQGFILKAKVFLLDEPFNGVDIQSKFEIFRALDEIKRSSLQIIVVHDLLDIKKLNSDVLLLENGSAQKLSPQTWFKKMDSQFHTEICHMGEL